MPTLLERTLQSIGTPNVSVEEKRPANACADKLAPPEVSVCLNR
jgi:hypothetical protein